MKSGLHNSTRYTTVKVGAGLLAKAACQLMNVLADPPYSRASPLPHLIGVGHKKGPRLGAFLVKPMTYIFG
ncbi:hypothetical protein C7U57_04245 [Pseudomonas sp. R9.37]|nr:hypothetical protein C7U57_04245 [Pseudomonas sp. R9.37]